MKSSLGEKAYMIIPRSLLDHLEEANVLASVAGYDIVRVWRTRYTWRVGRGLVDAIAREAERDKPSTIIFYGDPKPSTVFTLAKTMKVRVVDRVALILEIFAKHAGSREALLQIEMARIKHELPLVREWIRRSKLGELPGFLGPGGYAIDSYYRHLTSRLSKLRRELEELREVRSVRLKARRESGMIHVAIVGYASAGKTSLFNAITGESRRVGEEYFTTLHPKHKAVQVNGFKIVFIDTVGFIRDVPPEIVEAFHSVLEEIRISDVIMFVVDVSESDNIVREKVEAGIETLAKIEALGLPTVIAANKIDRVDGETLASKVKLLESAALNAGLKFRIVPTSALDHRGLKEL
ncbi:MAG: GTPase HflX, partial [Acidilobaceae archaeon]